MLRDSDPAAPTHVAPGTGPAAQPAPGRPARLPKPEWLKVKVPQGERFTWIRDRARTLNLHTVCEEARCPNIGECWQGGTATFMLMGDECTRGCRFCSVKTAKQPGPLDAHEPAHIAETIRAMGLDYVVLTTVNRDELPDQGSAHIAETIRRTQLANPELLIEVLIPDFRGDEACLDRVIAARPAVLAHNVETVPRLTPSVRDPRAGFEQSLRVLDYAKRTAVRHAAAHHAPADGTAPAGPLGLRGERPALRTKSSLMLGLGEREDEVLDSMRALRGVDVDFLTLGQYLQPDRWNLPVVEYIQPERFKALEQEGLAMGFRYVASGPLVRSSYRAAEFFIAQDLRGHSSP